MTCGTWRFEAVSDACRVVTGSGRKKVILARLAPKQIPEAETTANAHVMSAAKDLYDALEGALRLLEIDGSRHNIWHAALAKARGESE